MGYAAVPGGIMRCTLLLLAISACSAVDEAPTDDSDPPEDLSPPDWTAPDDWGPWGVGVTRVQRTAPSGEPTWVEVWYPAVVTDDTEPESYDEVLQFFGRAQRDAPVDPRGDRWPLVGFSHGYGGIRFQSIFLTEWLASHGMVVVAPDHAGSHLYDLDPDGAARTASERPRELSAALDLVLGTDAPLGLDARVDPDRVGVVGHSFGAITTLAVVGGAPDAEHLAARCAPGGAGGRICGFLEGGALDADLLARADDPRVRTAVALAPGGAYVFGPEGEGLSQARDVMVLAGTRDEELPYETEARPVFEALPSGTRLATLTDAGHWAFSDLCGILPVSDCAGAEGGYMPVARVQDVTRVLVTAHLRATLSSSSADEPWIDGAEDVLLEVR